MLARRVERMCKYIFKCVLVCCFLPVSFFLSPPLFPRCGGVRLLSWSAVPPSADQYVAGFFSLSEEKTQLVLNVDKQLEEVRELVCLWSVIFSSSHFLNNEFVERGRGQFSLAPDNSTCIILVVTWHVDITHMHTYFTWRKGGFLLIWLLSHNLLLSDTPMTHFKPLSWVGVFMLLFKHEQSHLTETNCCCGCLVMP